MKKRWISILLTVCLIVGMVPAVASGASDNSDGIAYGTYVCKVDSGGEKYGADYRPTLKLNSDKTFAFTINFGEGMETVKGTFTTFPDETYKAGLILKVSTKIQGLIIADTYSFSADGKAGQLFLADGRAGITPAESLFELTSKEVVTPTNPTQPTQPTNPTSSTSTDEGQVKAEALKQLGLFQGVSATDFALNKKLTRAESVIMFIRMIGEENSAKSGFHSHNFNDIPRWADDYISYAYQKKYANGVSNSRFDSNGTATSAMYLTYMLRSLGYSDSNGDFTWNSPFSLATTVGILPSNVDIVNFDRGDAALISFNMLNAKYKNGSETVGDRLVSKGVFTKAQLDSALNYVKNSGFSTEVKSTSNAIKEGLYLREDKLSIMLIVNKNNKTNYYINTKDKDNKKGTKDEGFIITSEGKTLGDGYLIEFKQSGNNITVKTDWMSEMYGMYNTPDGVYVPQKTNKSLTDLSLSFTTVWSEIISDDFGDDEGGLPGGKTPPKEKQGKPTNQETPKDKKGIIGGVQDGGGQIPPGVEGNEQELKEKLEQLENNTAGVYNTKFNFKGTKKFVFDYNTNYAKLCQYISFAKFGNLNLNTLSSGDLNKVYKNADYLWISPLIGDTVDATR